MTFTTWVRAQDAFGRFDVRKGDDLRDGVILVPGYPEHVGMTGRPGKPFVDLRVETESYKAKRVDELLDAIDGRNATSDGALDQIIVPADAEKKDLIRLLEADDKARADLVSIADQAAVEAEPADDTTSDAPASGTGEDLTTTDAGTGAGSEN